MNEPSSSPVPPSQLPVVDATLKKETLQTQRYKPLYRVTQIVWYLTGLIEVLLFFRFLFKLFGANPNAGFTRFIYGATELFAAPFFAVFRASQAAGAVFEWSTLLAMAVYLLIAWLIVKALVMSRPVGTEEAAEKLPEQEKV